MDFFYNAYEKISSIVTPKKNSSSSNQTNRLNNNQSTTIPSQSNNKGGSNVLEAVTLTETTSLNSKNPQGRTIQLSGTQLLEDEDTSVDLFQMGSSKGVLPGAVDMSTKTDVNVNTNTPRPFLNTSDWGGYNTDKQSFGSQRDNDIHRNDKPVGANIPNKGFGVIHNNNNNNNNNNNYGDQYSAPRNTSNTSALPGMKGNMATPSTKLIINMSEEDEDDTSHGAERSNGPQVRQTGFQSKVSSMGTYDQSTTPVSMRGQLSNTSVQTGGPMLEQVGNRGIKTDRSNNNNTVNQYYDSFQTNFAGNQAGRQSERGATGADGATHNNDGASDTPQEIFRDRDSDFLEDSAKLDNDGTSISEEKYHLKCIKEMYDDYYNQFMSNNMTNFRNWKCSGEEAFKLAQAKWSIYSEQIMLYCYRQYNSENATNLQFNTLVAPLSPSAVTHVIAGYDPQYIENTRSTRQKINKAVEKTRRQNLSQQPFTPFEQSPNPSQKNSSAYHFTPMNNPFQSSTSNGTHMTVGDFRDSVYEINSQKVEGHSTHYTYFPFSPDPLTLSRMATNKVSVQSREMGEGTYFATGTLEFNPSKEFEDLKEWMKVIDMRYLQKSRPVVTHAHNVRIYQMNGLHISFRVGTKSVNSGRFYKSLDTIKTREIGYGETSGFKKIRNFFISVDDTLSCCMTNDYDEELIAQAIRHRCSREMRGLIQQYTNLDDLMLYLMNFFCGIKQNARDFISGVMKIRIREEQDLMNFVHQVNNMYQHIIDVSNSNVWDTLKRGSMGRISFMDPNFNSLDFNRPPILQIDIFVEMEAYRAHRERSIAYLTPVQQTSSRTNGNCFDCGKVHEEGKCKFKSGDLCTHCHKKGHVWGDCWQRKKEVDPSFKPPKSKFKKNYKKKNGTGRGAGAVSNKTDSDKIYLWIQGPNLNKDTNQPLLTILDSGSPASFIKKEEAVLRGLVMIEITEYEKQAFNGASGHVLYCSHKCEVEFYCGEGTVSTTFYVADNIEENIISFVKLGKTYKGTSMGFGDNGEHTLKINNCDWIRVSDSTIYTNAVITVQQMRDILGYHIEDEDLKDIEDPWELLHDLLTRQTKPSSVNRVGVSAQTRQVPNDLNISEFSNKGASPEIPGRPPDKNVFEEWRKNINVVLNKSQEKMLMETLFPEIITLNKELPVVKQRNDVEMEINTDPSKHFHQKMRNLKENQKTFLRETTAKLLSAGLISLTENGIALCVSNPTLPLKSDGTIRFCVDYRQLNGITLSDMSHIPSVQQVVDKMLHNARFFICLDIRSAFWHVPIKKEDKLKTCFYGADGDIYAWNVAPFGAKNSPAVFHRFMQSIFKDIEGVAYYVDDLLIQGTTIDELLNRFSKVIALLKKYDIAVNIKKFQMGESVQMLGMIRDKDGLHPNPKKVEALKNVGRIQNRKDLLRVLGMIRYLSNMIPNVGINLAPFYKKTSSKVRWKWKDEDQENLLKIINQISDKMTIFLPDPSKQFCIRIDASNEGIGGYLFQYEDMEQKKERPILFFSKAFNETQSRWSIVEREAYAVVYAIGKCSRYVDGTKFLVFSDHKPLLWMLNYKWNGTEKAKVFRWLLTIMQYDFQVIHQSGKSNVVADALSRSPCVSLLTQTESVGAIVTNNLPNPETDSAFEEDAFEILMRAKLTNSLVPEELNKPVFDSVRREVEFYQKDMQIVSERLCYVDKDGQHKINGGLRYYIPVKDRADILFLSHNSIFSGHFGIDITLKKLEQSVWWPHMKDDVIEYIKFCELCQRFKSKSVLNEEMHPIDRAACFERVHLDLIGPLPRSSSGNVHIFHLVDSATKYSVTAAIPDKSAETISRVLVQHVIMKYGVPISIVTDQAKELNDKINTELSLLLGINRRNTSPYHPAANGQVERKNGILMNVLKMMVNKEQDNWDEMLPYATFAVNTAIPRGLIHSPFFLMFGRQPYNPLDVAVGSTPAILTKFQWWKGLQDARRLASESEGLVRIKAKKYFDSKITPHNFKVGDRVLVRFTSPGLGKSTKLSVKQSGPYEILKIEEGSATVKHVTMDQILTRRVDRLVPYNENLIFENLREAEEILEERIVDGSKEYLVRWKGFDHSDDTWITEEQLAISKDILIDWKKKTSSPLKDNSPKNLTVKRRSQTPVSPTKTPVKIVRRTNKKNDNPYSKKIEIFQILNHRKKSRRGGYQFFVITEEDQSAENGVWLDSNIIINQDIVSSYKELNNL